MNMSNDEAVKNLEQGVRLLLPTAQVLEIIEKDSREFWRNKFDEVRATEAIVWKTLEAHDSSMIKVMPVT